MAQEGWRPESGAFRIGVVAGEDEASARYEGFRKTVAETLGMPARIVPFRDATSVIDALAAGRIDYAEMSALGFATANQACSCVQPVAAPVSEEGATAFRAILLVDRGKVSQSADLENVAIGYGPRGSLYGDILPAAQFSWNGVALPDARLDLVEVASAQDGLQRLSLGSLGAMFAWEYVRPGTANAFTDGIQSYLADNSTSRFDVLWRSEPVRFGPHVVGSGVPASIRSDLRRMLVGLNDNHPDIVAEISPIFGGGFDSVTVYDYRSATDLVKQIAGRAD